MATEDKELRLNILVTEEGNGVLHRALSRIEHPKRRARHLLHLALTGLYAEAFLNASPAVLQKGGEKVEPLRASAPEGVTVQPGRANPSAAKGGIAPTEKPGNQRAGLDLVDVKDM
jgi:hypothetical protein